MFETLKNILRNDAYYAGMVTAGCGILGSIAIVDIAIAYAQWLYFGDALIGAFLVEHSWNALIGMGVLIIVAALLKIIDENNSGEPHVV